MLSQDQFEELLRNPRIWKAGRAPVRTAVCTGWPELDQALGGGWPVGQLIELFVEVHGVGEISLLLPALCRLTARGDRHDGASRWAAFVAPPYVPYAPAMARSGLDLSKLLLVRTQQDIDTLWAMEQALCTRTCAAVVGWVQAAAANSLRRLQLAAESSDAWVVVFRPLQARRSRSPAPLRIHLARERAGKRLLLSVFKCRTGSPRAVVTLAPVG